MHKLLEEDFMSIWDYTKYLNIKNKTVLITGATGFIGSYITRFFIFLNKEFYSNNKIYLIVRDKEKAQKMFDYDKLFYGYPSEADLIFHCASNAMPKKNEEDCFGVIDTNVLMTKTLLELAKKNHAKMVYFSAGEIYGDALKSKIVEDEYYGIDPTKLRSNYGLTKALGENLCYHYASKYGVKVYVVRLFHTYGIGMDIEYDVRIHARIIHSMVSGEPLVVYQNRLPLRAFTYISDAVRAIFLIMFAGRYGTPYNVGQSEHILPLETIIKKLSRLYGFKVVKLFNENATRPYQYLIPDCSMLHKLGWKPRYDIWKGFARSAEYYKKDAV